MGVDDANVGGGGGSNFAFRIDTVDITGVVTTITITNEGQGYRNGDTLSVPASSLGNASGTAPQFQVTSFPGGIEGLTFDSKVPDNVFVIDIGAAWTINGIYQSIKSITVYC